MKRPPIGAFPDSFGERLYPCNQRIEPGAVGQFINTAHLLTNVGDSRRADRLGWPIEHLLPYCVFDWAPGDGNAPYVGPVLDITDGGGPDETDVSPWQDSTGAVVGSAYFDGTVARRTATLIAPTAGQHVRLLALAFPVNDRVAGNNRIFSTRNTSGFGISLYYRASLSRWSAAVVDSGGTTVVHMSPYYGWTLLDVYWPPAGNVRLVTNGTAGTSAAPGGVHGAPDGTALGALPDGTDKYFGRVSRVIMFYGDAGLDNTTDHNGILAYVFGARDAQRNGVPTTTRATVGVQLRDTHYHLIGQGASRAGGDEGLLAEPTRVNKVYNNANPAATTGWSATGGTMSVVDDTAALRTVGLLEWGPMVHRFVPGGADRITYSGAATGNVNAHSISVWLRGAAGGESVDVGVRDISSGAFQNVQTVVCTTAWQKVTLHGFIPGDTDRQYGLDCDTGDTIYHIGDHMEEAARCSSPIPNLATAATAQRNVDDFLTVDDPADGGGSFEVTLEPVDWSANELGTVGIVYLSGSGNPALWAEAGTWRARIDGTTNLNSGVAPVAGTPHRIRLRWVTGGQQSMEVWDATPQLLARVQSAYDGTLYSAGTWEIASGAPVLASRLLTYRNGGG